MLEQLTWANLTVFLGGVATLAIFSFLIRENQFYRLFEHLFIGISSGILVVVGIKTFLWPRIFVPLLGLDIVTYPDGSTSAPYNPLVLFYILPIVFGCLYYFIFSKRHAWLAKMVIGFSLGMAGGLSFKGFFAEMLPQLSSSFKPLVLFESDGQLAWFASFSNMVFVYTLLAVMLYFFFTFKFESKAFKAVSTSGRWLMMVCFGAFFGSTVMARMAILVERIQFLIEDWWQLLVRLVAGA